MAGPLIDSKSVRSILVRIGRVSGDIRNIVQAHTNVIEERGSVWFAILGSKVLSESLRQLPQSSLYLVQKSGTGFTTYKGKIIDVSKELRASDHAYVPSYYFSERIFEKSGGWVRLSCLEEVSGRELEYLKVVSSGSDVLSALRGMAPYMFVANL